MHSHVASGAALGFLGGAVVGGVIGYLLSLDQGEMSGIGVVLGVPVGGVVGMLVGGNIGYKRTERWDRLRLPISIGLLPGTDVIGLSVGVSIR